MKYNYYDQPANTYMYPSQYMPYKYPNLYN